MTRSLKGSKWHTVHPSVVCHAIARVALLTDAADVNKIESAASDAVAFPFGEITLRDHQLDALLRLRVAMREFGGGLLADAVGMGKTYVALALAREFSDVHILAPATLLPMWRSAVTITGSRHVALHSLHRLSRGPIHLPAVSARSLVIIDEAHHLRARTTARYDNVLSFTAGREVLLLTATPLHNREHELRNLLALFLGQRADALDHATLARCVVRRSSTDAGAASLPTVRTHEPHRLPDNHMVLECLLTLPPPLPVHLGAAASALVRLGLLRAWCSSDAALSDSIRRRQLRGEALLHSLAHGRYPTQRELQSWIVGNDSVQLGFPELLVATASGDTADLLKTLLAHLDGLQGLLQLHTRTAMADARRVELLRSLVGTETLTMPASHNRADRRTSAGDESVAPPAIVAFSQFASTVRALHRALSDLAGIALLTSDGGRIASGPIARHELIASFAPIAHGRPPPPAHERIRLLLTTDLLAEGVNLQDAGVVVHLDLPWTDALRQQRVGRLARMGALHSFIDVHTFEPPMGADAVLRIAETLERKARLHQRLVGVEPVGRDATRARQLSGPDEATQLREYWQSWLRADHHSHGALESVSQATVVARVKAAEHGWIAAIEIQGDAVVVASCGSTGAEISTIYRAVRAIATSYTVQSEPQPMAAARGVELSAKSYERALDQLQQWLHTRAIRHDAGPVARAISPIQQHALAAVSSRFTSMSSPARPTIASRVSDIERQILRTRGAGAERLLELWVNTASTVAIAEWLAAFPRQRTVAAELLSAQNAPPALVNSDSASDTNAWRLTALLILEHEPNQVTSTR